MNRPHTVAQGLPTGRPGQVPLGPGGQHLIGPGGQHLIGPGGQQRPPLMPGQNGGGIGPWWTWPQNQPHHGGHVYPNWWNWGNYNYYPTYSGGSVYSFPVSSQVIVADNQPLCNSQGPSGALCAANGNVCVKTGPLRVNQYGHTYDGVCVNPRLL